VRTSISQTFARLRREGGKAFIPYVMAGDPSIGRSREIVLLFEKCGADIVELGVPFSDPLADGPIIQRAAERSLRQGTSLRSVISFVREVRGATQIPIVLMTYFNPVFRYGPSDFIRDARGAGVDGVVIPDLPPEEATDFVRSARRLRLDTIFLLAPTSTEERIRKVVHYSSGFIYYVSITGITGAELLLDGSMERSIAQIRQRTTMPIAVGFGVSTPDEAAHVARLSDGVIVGSAIVKRLGDTRESLERYLTALRQAIA